MVGLIPVISRLVGRTSGHRELHFLTGYHIGLGPSGRQGQGVHEGLECGTGLPGGKNSVVTGLRKIPPSHHGADLPVADINRHQCPLQGLWTAFHPLGQGPLGSLLHGQIQGGIDLEPALKNHILPILLDQIFPYHSHKIGSVSDNGMVPFVLKRLLGDAVSLRLGYIAFSRHAFQDHLLPGFGPVRMHIRVKTGRIIRQSGQQSGFGHSQLAGFLAEKGARRYFYAGSTLAEIDGITVQRQYLVFAVFPFENNSVP